VSTAPRAEVWRHALKPKKRTIQRRQELLQRWSYACFLVMRGDPTIFAGNMGQHTNSWITPSIAHAASSSAAYRRSDRAAGEAPDAGLSFTNRRPGGDQRWDDCPAMMSPAEEPVRRSRRVARSAQRPRPRDFGAIRAPDLGSRCGDCQRWNSCGQRYAGSVQAAGSRQSGLRLRVRSSSPEFATRHIDSLGRDVALHPTADRSHQYRW
jgi:hypothetical protein